MRTYYDIRLGDRTIAKREMTGEQLVNGGRYHIAKTLLELGAATADPLSPANPLIFSAGPFAGATPYLGKGNFEANRMLLARYGKKIATALCGPVGEYQGLLGGIAFTDKDLRPSRLAARGGVGAVMGSKKVKAIVLDMDKIPPFSDPKKVNASIKDYSKMLLADGIVTNFYQPLGTMGMADVQNQMGGLPVRNFSAGQLADASKGETFKMGGQFIAPLNTGRGGEQTHACMPGCVIQCSNVYVDASGKEIVSPVEYETLGLLGSNCGLTDPDDLAVLMEAGLGRFGDAKFMAETLREIMRGTSNGRIWAQGTARVGEHYKVRRVPVIKKQAISAYDPRVVEATGISMMATAQGADHTAGNLPRLKTREMDLESLLSQSLAHQARVAANDSLGLCIFGMSVTNPNTEWLTNAINAAHGTQLTPAFFEQLGRDALRYEKEFNRQAGFTEKDDELPAFFYEESLPPTNHVARFHGADVHRMYERLPG